MFTIHWRNCWLYVYHECKTVSMNILSSCYGSVHMYLSLEQRHLFYQLKIANIFSISAKVIAHDQAFWIVTVYGCKNALFIGCSPWIDFESANKWQSLYSIKESCTVKLVLENWFVCLFTVTWDGKNKKTGWQISIFPFVLHPKPLISLVGRVELSCFVWLGKITDLLIFSIFFIINH